MQVTVAVEERQTDRQTDRQTVGAENLVASTACFSGDAVTAIGVRNAYCHTRQQKVKAQRSEDCERR